jgi:hypothetical protein
MNGSASVPSLGDDERHFVRHQARNEMHVTRQTIQLGNDDSAFPLPGLGEACGELRATIQGIRALAGFDFDMLGDDLKTLSLGKPGKRRALRFES